MLHWCHGEGNKPRYENYTPHDFYDPFALPAAALSNLVPWMFILC